MLLWGPNSILSAILAGLCVAGSLPGDLENHEVIRFLSSVLFVSDSEHYSPPPWCMWLVGHSMDSRTSLQVFQYKILHCLAVWPHGGYLTFLNFSYFSFVITHTTSFLIVLLSERNESSSQNRTQYTDLPYKHRQWLVIRLICVSFPCPPWGVRARSLVAISIVGPLPEHRT